jgi:hypothetical protein
MKVLESLRGCGGPALRGMLQRIFSEKNLKRHCLRAAVGAQGVMVDRHRNDQLEGRGSLGERDEMLSN